jgi:hypothetical protein
MVVVVVLTLAAGVLANTTVAVSRLGPVARERALAMEAARNLVERMGGEDFDDLFARYNSDPADDPDGPGTAPGDTFDVTGLTPRVGDADGLVGQVILPTVGAELREDVADAILGTPRDLDFDGEIDSEDHAGDYLVLPVRVRVEWRGPAGPCSFELVTQLTAP